MAEDPIIRYEPADDTGLPGRLDEFIARGCDVHFEAMSDSQFWMEVDLPDGRSWHLNFGAKNYKAEGYAFVEEIAPTALVAMADAERAEMGADIERLCEEGARQEVRAEAAEAEVAALRGQIEALADEVRTAPAETWGVPLHVPSNAEAAYMAGADAAITFATRRLAALAASPAEDTTPAAPQAEDGAR